MKMRMKVVFGAVMALVASGAIGPAAMATPASGPPSFPDLPATFRTTPPGTVTGILDGPTKAKNDGIELKVKGDVDVASFELNYPIGSFSGWHSHPGIVIANVRSGAVWRQVGCTATRFSAGEAFTEVAPHYVSNVYTIATQDGAVPAVLEITQIYPKGETVLRQDQPAPRCPYGIHYVE